VASGKDARRYGRVEKIRFDAVHFCRDIAAKAFEESK
jgi:hypothetical protein